MELQYLCYIDALQLIEWRDIWGEGGERSEEDEGEQISDSHAWGKTIPIVNSDKKKIKKMTYI